MSPLRLGSTRLPRWAFFVGSCQVRISHNEWREAPLQIVCSPKPLYLWKNWRTQTCFGKTLDSPSFFRLREGKQTLPQLSPKSDHF